MLKTTFIQTCLLVACLVVMLGIVPSGKAVEVADLYLVKWPVSDQNNTARWRAALAGFKEVLVRKSGSQQILRDDGVQQAYRKVTSYLQRFEYIHQDDSNEEFPYIISLYFEPRLIDALIREAKLPLWGSNRPLTILWLAVESEDGRQIVGANSDSPALQVVENNATRRGLPLITPLMDLEDELIVTTSDVWGRFSSTISQASQRYFSDSQLIGKIQAMGESWRGQFTYINQGKELAFELSSSSQEILLADMTDKLAELLCSKYCVVEQVGETNEVMLRLSGVNNFVEYKAAEVYLESLSAIRKLYLVGIDEHTLKIRVSLLGDLESLIKGISLGNQMTVVELEDRLPKQLVSDKEENDQALIDGANILDAESVQNESVAGSLNTTRAKTNHILSNEKEYKNKIPLEVLYYRWNG